MEAVSWYWTNKVLETIMCFIYVHPCWSIIIFCLVFSGRGHSITCKKECN